jgi:glutathione S-transferase
MKLFYSPLTSHVHKVQVVAIEAGIYERIERVPTRPFERDPALVAVNPLSKVPTLVRDDGVVLYGGPVIYEYLDSLHDGPKMFPPAGEARLTALRQMALGDGLFDITTLWASEILRPDGEKSATVIARHAATIERCLDALENEAPAFAGFTIGHICIAGALGYLERQLTQGRLAEDWRGTRPALATWYAEITKRPSFQPHDADFRRAFDAGDTSSRRGV